MEKAENFLLQCLMITTEFVFTRDIINLLCEFARLQDAKGDSEQAVELLVFVLQHPASHESRLLEGRIEDSAADLLAKIEAELPQEIINSALERGQELELDEVVAGLIGQHH